MVEVMIKERGLLALSPSCLSLPSLLYSTEPMYFLSWVSSLQWLAYVILVLTVALV